MTLGLLETPVRRYAGAMTTRELRSAQEVRDGLAARIDEALAGNHTIVTRHARPVAVLVDINWYRKAAALMGEPTDL